MSKESSPPATASTTAADDVVVAADDGNHASESGGSGHGSGTPGPLQQGESYASVDYRFMKHIGDDEANLNLILSYDIAYYTMTLYRCEPPFFPDPGQPTQPQPGQKLYLVCGRNLRAPGVYASWPTAEAEWKSVPRDSGSSCKSYYSLSKLRSAWYARCDCGEHDHPVDPALVNAVPLYFISSPSPSPERSPPPYVPVGSSNAGTWQRQASYPPPATSPSPVQPRVPRSPVAIPRPRPPAPAQAQAPSRAAHGAYFADRRAPASAPGARAPAATARVPPPSATSPPSPDRPATATPAASAQPLGLASYAVRIGGEGEVFTSAHEARHRFLTLQSEGKSPSMVSCASLARCLKWIQDTPLDTGPATTQLRGWAEEENRARRERVEAQREREVHRMEILAALDVERREIYSSDSDGESLVSDLSRSTADLEAELGHRAARSTWRRVPS
ncbi:hypothetical protein C8R43DRAFT_1128509 [Mycena crocata]|nr:hypothetical protein C8R43DRAFT_1128509 [Mycena crocata]